jgi:hypothetical protein
MFCPDGWVCIGGRLAVGPLGGLCAAAIWAPKASRLRLRVAKRKVARIECSIEY